MLYGADNQRIRRTIPMQSAQVRALIDGDYFLTHGASALPAMLLEPYCLRCAAAGSVGTVTLSMGLDKVTFRCAHISGHVLTRRGTEVEPLLHALGWGLRCTACHEAACGDNAKSAATFTVTCACTTRELANPHAPILQ